MIHYCFFSFWRTHLRNLWQAPALLVCSLILAGCGDNTSQQQGQQQQKGPQATPVSVMTLKQQAIDYTEKLPGRVVPFRQAEIRPQVSGIIQARLFEEGTLVEKGQQLYQIDPERYQADLEMAQANLANAQAAVDNAQTRVNRFDGLAKINALSEQELDDATTNLKQARAAVSQAEAAVKTAKINLAFTKVYAPIDGFIGPSRVTEGALVTQQQAAALATIRQLDPVYVDLSQSVGDAQQLKARLIESRIQQRDDTEFAVRLFFSQSGEPYEHVGKLDATDLAVDEQTGAIRLRSVFPNPDKQLLPGLFVRASIEGLSDSQALVVPQKSVQIGPGGAKHVWVMTSDNKASKRSVQTGLAYEGNWVVEQGLKAGDKVIVQNTMRLKEGAPVKANTERSGKAEAAAQGDSSDKADSANQGAS